MVNCRLFIPLSSHYVEYVILGHNTLPFSQKHDTQARAKLVEFCPNSFYIKFMLFYHRIHNCMYLFHRASQTKILSSCGAPD